ncbi:MAG: transglutaminase-like domain-containing protein [Oscillochloridaceae bacterium umkhey_bin13]
MSTKPIVRLWVSLALLLSICLGILPPPNPALAVAPTPITPDTSFEPTLDELAAARYLEALIQLDIVADKPELRPGELQALYNVLAYARQNSHPPASLTPAMVNEHQLHLSTLRDQVAQAERELLIGVMSTTTIEDLRATTRTLLGQAEQSEPIPLNDIDDMPTVVTRLATTPTLTEVGSVNRDTPGWADVLPSIDAPFDPEIRALAAELGYDPLRIYQFVQNSITFDPYLGSKKGAIGALWERRANDIDTASLLAALLRVSGYPTRYITGTIVLDRQQALDLVGGVETLEQVAAIFPTVFNPTITDDGQFLVSHTWVEFFPEQRFFSFLPLVQRSRVAATQQNHPLSSPSLTRSAAWIPLAPAIKAYRRPEPAPALESTINTAALLEALIAHSEIDHELQSFRSSLFVPNPDTPLDPGTDLPLGHLMYMQSLAEVDAYFAANPTVTTHQLRRTPEIVAVTDSTLPTQLPFRRLASDPPTSFAVIPSELRWEVTYELLVSSTSSRPLIAYTAPLPVVFGSRVSIAYEAASSLDEERLSASILQAPVATRMVPVMRVNGQEVGRSTTAGALDTSRFHRMTIRHGDGQTNIIGNNHGVGDMIVYAISVGTGSLRAVAEGEQRLRTALEALPIDATGAIRGDSPEIMSEAIIAETLNLVMQHYYLEFATTLETTARQISIRQIPGTIGGFAMFRLGYKRNYFFSTGTPVEVLGATYAMDLPFGRIRGVNIGASAADRETWDSLWSKRASNLEHEIFERLGIRSLSTVRVLNTALMQGQTAYVITPENRATTFPRLQLPSWVERAISARLDEGRTIFVHDRELRWGDWRGTGYLAQRPNVRSGSFIIAGGVGDQVERLGGSGTDLLRNTAYFLGMAKTIAEFERDIAQAAAAITLGLASANPIGVGIGIGVGILKTYPLQNRWIRLPMARRYPPVGQRARLR